MYRLRLRDPIARYLALFPVAALVFGVMLPWLVFNDPGVVPGGAALALLGAASVYVRLAALHALLEGGRETPGEVAAVSAERGVTHVEYTYVYAGRRYREANYARGRVALVAGQAVRIMVDPREPERSLVRELYP